MFPNNAKQAQYDPWDIYMLSFRTIVIFVIKPL